MKEKKTSPADLRLLENHEINLIKWDNCINNAHNGSIYGFSWYLDIVCENWQAMIQNDYEAVMPVLTKKKAGISYALPSPFASQLGVFSTEIIDQEMVNTFIRKVDDNYPLFTVNLNKFNRVAPHLFRQHHQLTYEFDVIRDYDLIRENYSTRVQADLDKAAGEKITTVPGLTPKEFIRFITDKGVFTSRQLSKARLNKLRMIIAFVIKHGLGEILSAYTRENNLCASILFLKSNRKINLLFSAATREGYDKKALELIIDHYLQKYAGKNLTISFEHLAVPDKVNVCKGFGATEYHYTTVSNLKNPLFRRIFS